MVTEKIKERIYGEKIFFNFKETQFDASSHADYIDQMIDGRLDGMVIKEIFTQEEISRVLDVVKEIPDDKMMMVPTGKVFPNPFATITDSGAMLDNYVKRLTEFNGLKGNEAIKNLTDKLHEAFCTVTKNYNVNPPRLNAPDMFASPGNFRIFSPDHGGLFVHCGYLFQEQSPYYYNVVEPMKLEDQLSYFVVLQNSEIGGELTIYDMLWKDIKAKDSATENDYVIDGNGNKLYLSDVANFAVRPHVGDMLIFRGGPIWHRVENISGSIPRITFGGFLNLTADSKGIRYWS